MARAGNWLNGIKVVAAVAGAGLTIENAAQIKPVITVQLISPLMYFRKFIDATLTYL